MTDYSDSTTIHPRDPRISEVVRLVGERAAGGQPVRPKLKAPCGFDTQRKTLPRLDFAAMSSQKTSADFGASSAHSRYGTCDRYAQSCSFVRLECKNPLT